MFELLAGNIEETDPAMADRIYRFRHAFFVETLGWEACRKPDGRERDQFDGPDCLHVVGAEQGEVVSYARLLPTTRPHLLTHVYPEILKGGTAPAGPKIYEWTRHAVAPHKREAATGRAFSRAAVAEAVEAMNLDGLLVQTHPVLVDRLMDMGWDVEPLALPILYKGALLLPIYARSLSETVSLARAALASYGSTLERPGRSVRRTPFERPAVVA